MSRTLRPLAALAILALLAPIVAGCSNAPADAGSSGGNNIAVTFSAPTDTAPTDTSSGGNNIAFTPSAPADTAPADTAPADAGSSGGNTTAATHEQAVKFAECMRDNGVSEFPDPDASGTFTIETIANGTSIDTNSAAFKRAITACKDLEPPGFTGFSRTPEQQQAALKFAQCIRDNGVKDFPDPAIDEPLVDTNRIPSTNTTGGMNILNAAMRNCDAAAAGVTGP